MEKQEVKLTRKQQLFIAEYCVDMNATRAAIAAGYSPASAYEIGSQNLRKLEIQRAIDARLDEMSMKAGEATRRLTDWGRGSFLPFVEQDKERGIVLDLTKEDAMKNIHLIKKMKQTKKVFFNDEGKPGGEEITTEIELYDAMAAVDKIAKIRGLYADKVRPGSEDEEEKVDEFTFTIKRSRKDGNTNKDVDKEGH